MPSGFHTTRDILCCSPAPVCPSPAVLRERVRVRVPGTIVGYKQEYFPGSFGRSSRSSQAFMPIVKFRAGLQDVQFKDWMGTNNAVKNIRVTVLYDPEKPSLAMIDRPVWNWIPWAPTLGVGLFLFFVGARGWIASRNRQALPWKERHVILQGPGREPAKLAVVLWQRSVSGSHLRRAPVRLTSIL